MSDDTAFEFTQTKLDFALENAYIPEHIPGLMVGISGATPFLIDNHLGYARDNWVIFIGYPLRGQFDAKACTPLIGRVREMVQPDYVWFIAPEIPSSLKSSCRTRQSDQYYYLDLADYAIKSSLQRQVRRAAEKLVVEQSREFDSEHQSLVEELMRRQKLSPLISELYRSMPEYIASCETARVLNARDMHGHLCAFFVVETAAVDFDTYLLGCHSKVNYIPHASDVLFSEMIMLAERSGKPGINLGLGVNSGIRRFKMKWGGMPFLKYEYCELHYGPPEKISIINLLLGEGL